jgi:hypothetical protein
MDLRALIFMPSFAAAVVFGFVFVLFLSHYYLTVLEGTATGSKEVTWMAEPILDNFWKLWYMLWLFGLWFGPGYLIAKAIAARTGTEWLQLWLPIGIVWVLYPVSQLSSLSASTIWLPLVPDVFARLAQKPAVTLGFYLLSIPVLALFAVAFKWAFLTKGEWEMLFLGAPLMVLALFLYARLIGRLAFVLAFTKPLLQRRRKKKAKPAGEGEELPAEENKEEVVPTITQPRDLPPLQSPEGELTGYDVAFEEAAPRKRIVAEVDESDADEDEDAKREPRQKPPPLPSRRKDVDLIPERSRVWTDEDEEKPTSYGVRAPEAVPIETIPQELVKPKEEEMRLLSRDDVPKQPTAAWGPELLVFLKQPGTITSMAVAAGFCFAVGVLVRICRDFNPLD